MLVPVGIMVHVDQLVEKGMYVNRADFFMDSARHRLSELKKLP